MTTTKILTAADLPHRGTVRVGWQEPGDHVRLICDWCEKPVITLKVIAFANATPYLLARGSFPLLVCHGCYERHAK